MKEIRVGSLFSGIGGMEIGLSRAIPNIRPAWFCEQNLYSQSILSKHWKGVPIYDDVRNINKSNVESIDILTGGFPCQSISIAGKMEGLENDEKSGLWWEMWRIVRDLRPRIVIMENVSNIIRLGGIDVVGSLTQIGYNSEWEIIRASDFGAPHKRARWFCVSWDTRTIENPRRTITNPDEKRFGTSNTIQSRRSTFDVYDNKRISTDPDGVRTKIQIEGKQSSKQKSRGFSANGSIDGYTWKGFPTQSPICRRNDGIPDRVDRIRALGNAIVPDCSEYVGRCVLKSGLLDDFYISAGEK